MSWKTKPSSTMQIPRRAEPYVSPAVAERWEREIVSKYHVRKGALMPILHELQHEHRCIPYQAMVEVARFLGISPAILWRTAPAALGSFAITMAIALVATLYGLLTANLFINPAGERILNRTLFEAKEGELALQAVLLASRGTPILQSQEFLNSFVPDDSRVNILQDASYRSERSAA
jgi:hypothetical protein